MLLILSKIVGVCLSSVVFLVGMMLFSTSRKQRHTSDYDNSDRLFCALLTAMSMCYLSSGIYFLFRILK